ncbi:nitrate reductase cytochrome c-type subunit [Shewanella gaetbuli]|uniref:Periplasmic nitrate reductase, electron transfer subunit n=1 Tax=Shewanella gaetbuli TaxID=220752 RepID=A0A9X1ZLR7_9GAMM|nr:nitrate reductase cytochrome c-type subunit [Shewanella gaetbuli]MCL1142230.1 nitrate reductase cytochrome c-type subunit [Shewanella gaetbuli]
MKKLLSVAAITLLLSACSGQQASTDMASVNVESLRQGETSATLPAQAMPNYPSKGAAIERTFVHQPPLVPHKDSYKISAKKNGCLTCHSTEKAARMKATPVDKSHLDASGEFNNEYYFCVQCHVAQADNKDAIVDNTHTK